MTYPIRETRQESCLAISPHYVEPAHLILLVGTTGGQFLVQLAFTRTQ
ncbi:hypothetical protein ACFWNK_10370 [Streptomyces sp. NPDC058417]